MSSLAPPPACGRTDAPAAPSRPRVPVRAGAGLVVLALRVGSIGVSTGTAILLARWMGVSGFGRFEAALGWASMLSLLAGAGLDRFAVREAAIHAARGEPAAARGVVRATLRLALVAGLIGGLVVVAWASAWTREAPTEFAIVALGWVPCMALLKNRQAGLQGLSRIVSGHVPELAVVPVALLLLVVCTGLGMGVARGELGLGVVLCCQLGALALGAAVAWVGYARATGGDAVSTPTRWLRAASPMMVVAALQFLNSRIDVVMLDALAPADEVGRYACANRLAALVALPLLAANGAVGPAMAGLAADGDHGGLQRALTQSARWSSLVALPVLLALCLFSDTALAVVGPEYVAAGPDLRALAVAQFLNVVVGSVGLVLMMSGHVRSVCVGLAVSGAVNVGLDALWIPSMGARGAAWATATSLVLWNVLLAIAVWRRLGVIPGAWGWRRPFKKGHA